MDRRGSNDLPFLTIAISFLNAPEAGRHGLGYVQGRVIKKYWLPYLN